MTTDYFIHRNQWGERALLVQVRVFQKEYMDNFDEALSEFQLLAQSASTNVLGVITGHLSRIHSKYFIGEGKVNEIKEVVQAQHIEIVFFNHELTSAQARNLDHILQCRVLDRSELILMIFSQRARTFEGKLQVELAQLEHLRTRLVRGWTHLERQKGGIGVRGGPGETQLEIDKRLIGVRIKAIKKRLEKVAKQREQNRRSRQRMDVSIIAVVGYTNAGKSTLFNRLTESTVYVADQLFATLDPTLRQISLPKIGQIILADTVGFIRHLPHELIAAFKSTLEETKQSDLLLHVIDASSEQNAHMIQDVNEVLQEIGASHLLQLQVMNKIDLIPHAASRIDYDEQGKPRRVWVSAQTGQGFDLLSQTIVELLSKRVVTCQVTLKPDQGRLRAKLYALNVVQSESINEEGQWILDLEIQQLDFERLFRRE